MTKKSDVLSEFYTPQDKEFKPFFEDYNFAVIDKETHKAISSKGGKRSGEVRRAKAARDKEAKERIEETMKVLFLSEQEYKEFLAWKRHKKYIANKKKGK